MLKLFYSIFLTIIMLVGAYAIPAMAQQRIALVVGNSNYQLIPVLKNPQNDAKLMAETLSGLGFDVTLAIDVDGRAMSRVVRKFGKKLRAAGDNAVGLFFYAGHGVSARGTNYLIPLGAEIESESDLELESMSASSILAQMMDARNALNLVILDACRNNPYKGTVRSITTGLTRVTTASGALIAFSAAPGQVAVDGNGSNSPYTAALVKAMRVPGIAIEQVFKKVRVSVENYTGGQQSPWEESSLRGDFYFVPGSSPQANLQTPQPQTPQPQISQPRITQPGNTQPQVFRSPVNGNTALQTEALFWKSVKDSRDPKTFAAYLETYPNGTFAGLAKVMMNNLLRETSTVTPSVPENTSRGQVLASLPPPEIEVVPEPPRPQYSLRERTMILQRELKRVGCDPGRIDGKWGPKGRRALSRFKRYARLDLDFDDLSDEVIDAVTQEAPNLCPEPVRKPRSKAHPVVIPQEVVKTRPAPQPQPKRTYGAQKRSRQEWQDCVIESITPNPITSGADC